MFGLDYSRFTPYLCRAIQEQQEIIEAEKAKALSRKDGAEKDDSEALGAPDLDKKLTFSEIWKDNSMAQSHAKIYVGAVFFRGYIKMSFLIVV